MTASNNSPPLFIPAHATEAADQNLPCQWCNARFANVVRLYQHSSSAHPNQVKEQEMAEGIHKTSSAADTPQLTRGGTAQSAGALNGDSRFKGQSKKGKHSPTFTKVNGKLVGVSSRPAVNTGMSLLHAPTLVAQLSHSQVLQTPQSLAITSAGSPEVGLNLSTKRPLSQPAATLFPCSRCSFTTLNPDDYLLHMTKHSQLQIQTRSLLNSTQSPKAQQVHEDELRCWFCGELQKSFLDVYQHMLEQHPTDLNERTEQREALMKKIAPESKSKSLNR